MTGLLDTIGDRRNVAGLLGAAAGLGLTFGGVIDTGWWAITGGLYAAGFLAAQALVRRRARPLEAAPVADLYQSLLTLAERTASALPEAARSHLANILTAAAGIEPRLRAIDPANPSVIAVRQILADYIPTTLQAFVNLPPRVRATAPLADGRTADVQITEQLALLEAQMDSVADSLSRGDLDALQAQGLFLRDKFQAPDLFAS